MKLLWQRGLLSFVLMICVILMFVLPDYFAHYYFTDEFYGTT